jgi:hypothetical protein
MFIKLKMVVILWVVASSTYSNINTEKKICVCTRLLIGWSSRYITCNHTSRTARIARYGSLVPFTVIIKTGTSPSVQVLGRGQHHTICILQSHHIRLSILITQFTGARFRWRSLWPRSLDVFPAWCHSQKGLSTIRRRRPHLFYKPSCLPYLHRPTLQLVDEQPGVCVLYCQRG